MARQSLAPSLEQQIFDEFKQAGAEWGPLRAGLFGGSTDRADAAFETFVEHAAKIRETRW